MDQSAKPIQNVKQRDSEGQLLLLQSWKRIIKWGAIE